MRWLLVSSQHHPAHGGIGTYVSRFVEAAADAGWEIDLVTRPGPLQPSGAAIHELTTADQDSSFDDRVPSLRRIERIRPYRYALWSKAIAEHLLTLEPVYEAIEFVDCQAEGFASVCSSRVRERWRGVPMIIHAHTPMFVEEQINGCDPSRFGRSIYHDWERRTLKACDGLIVTSRLLQSRLSPEPQTIVIPYPIKSSAVARSERALHEQILFVGSIQPRKGVDNWARSLNGVLEKRLNTTAAMVGPDTPTFPDGTSMAGYVRTLIARQFRDRFTWHGPRSHDEVTRSIAQAALVVVPSVFESFSFVAAEALDVGTPVLVSDQVGITEHVRDLPRCEAGNIKAWTESQCAMLDDQKGARRIALRCRDQMHQSCSPQRHLQNRVEFLRSLQAARSRRDTKADGPDALDELDAFIEVTDAMESSCAAVSSARS